MKWRLVAEYDVAVGENRTNAIELSQSFRPEVVLLDLGLPPSPGDPTEGLATLSQLLELEPHLKVVIITGQNEKQVALQAIERGAFDFLAKPIEIAELKIVLKRA